ncbi:hypothetical protein O0L34_g5235 [Tuta absoluta]|nr:hypothetical protein O0L34_g5235 [Tuta absoluta]
MIKQLFYIALAVAACKADAPVTPPVRCGETPNNLYRCLGNPQIIKHGVAAQCSNSNTECDRMKCIFEKSGWMDGVKVNKQKVIAHFEQFKSDHPAWSPAVDHVKSACLNGDLPAQSVYLNCPAYDIVHCALTGFIKNAQPSQWSTATECSYPRQYAAACPLCPSECFAPQIPVRSCNACILLPHSP